MAVSLPDYMIPDVFVRLDALPLTTNGKVDRRALPVPQSPEVRSRLPQSEEERRLAEIWKSVLGLTEVGVDDNFFSLGGDSIRSTQMVARARRDGFTLSVRDVLATPTIAALSRTGVMTSVPRTTRLARAVHAAADGRDIPLMPMQQWFFDPEQPTLDGFNQSIVLKTHAVLDAGALREALQDLVEPSRRPAPALSGSHRTEVADRSASIRNAPRFTSPDMCPTLVSVSRTRWTPVSAGSISRRVHSRRRCWSRSQRTRACCSAPIT